MMTEEQVEQMSFEGMPIRFQTSKLKPCPVDGLTNLTIGDKVRIVVEAEVVAVLHEDDEKLGGARTHILKATDAVATIALEA
ncbi:MAG: hypothetical protein ACR2M4_12460 [Actinomycetota bacterium]